jgi:hypothetical protein
LLLRVEKKQTHTRTHTRATRSAHFYKLDKFLRWPPLALWEAAHRLICRDQESSKILLSELSI